jgi:hypothetical protein
MVKGRERRFITWHSHTTGRQHFSSSSATFEYRHEEIEDEWGKGRKECISLNSPSHRCVLLVRGGGRQLIVSGLVR